MEQKHDLTLLSRQTARQLTENNYTIYQSTVVKLQSPSFHDKISSETGKPWDRNVLRKENTVNVISRESDEDFTAASFLMRMWDVRKKRTPVSYSNFSIAQK